MEEQNNKLIVILGPTSSGKTRLAVKLAREFDGEIISADSRQVYRGMDVGTGKDLAEYGEVKHHLIDVVEPTDLFSLAQYKKLAEAAIDDVIKRGKIPFLVGGSGLYLQAVVDNYDMAEVGVDDGLRQELEHSDILDLYDKLKAANPAFAAKVNESDRKNKRRLIRYIELNSSASKSEGPTVKPPKYDCLVLGLNPGKEIIDKKIRQRLLDRLENEDLVAEVDRLHTQGVSWQRLHGFGLEYRFISEYLQEKCDHETMFDRLNIAIRQFAKKQMTWFNRWGKQGRKIFWLEKAENEEEAVGFIRRFLA
ncbi:tRNA (adenosine(37)-N6)-dimethylallyltransferase MiaA [Candidatus Falkowbacteria bacterium]|nr:tRNA (adenosine(37)-N6)-dimethylallyltransferase MiaA [Candidatus Falkowbacteria bacterium]